RCQPPYPCRTGDRLVWLFMLDSPFLDCPFGVPQALPSGADGPPPEGRVGPLDRPTPAGRQADPPCSGGMVRRGVLRILGGTCGGFGDSCGHPERPRRDADAALEVAGDLIHVVVDGAELLTGNNLIVMAWASPRLRRLAGPSGLKKAARSPRPA